MRNRIFGTVLFVLCLSATASAIDKSKLVFIAGMAANYATAQSWDKDARIGPVIGRSQKQQLAIIGISTALTVGIGHLLHRTGHDKAEKMLYYSVGIGHVGATAWNINNRVNLSEASQGSVERYLPRARPHRQRMK
jgi:hypothetical protein